MNARKLEAMRRIADTSPHEGERAAARAAIERLEAKQTPPPAFRVVETSWANVIFGTGGKGPRGVFVSTV